LASLVAALILLLTVSTSLVLGIAAAYGAISGIIYLFAARSGNRPQRGPVLVPSQTPAIGD
jgi:hypothetical protein